MKRLNLFVWAVILSIPLMNVAPALADGYTAGPQRYSLPASFAEKSPFNLMSAESKLVSLRPASRSDCDGQHQAVFQDLTIADVTILSKAFPSNFSIGKAVPVKVTVVNCSGQNWDANFKIGTQAPVDYLWGANRILLPTNVPVVPNNYKITLRFVARMPMQAGTFDFTWYMVHEGVAWLSGSMNANLTVEFPDESLKPLCPGIDPSIKATPGLGFLEGQVTQCIAKTPDNGVLEFTPGVYYITQKINVNRPMTIRTKGLSNQPYNCLSNEQIDCAMFIAHPRFNAGEDVTVSAYNGLFYAGVITQADTMGGSSPNFGNVNVDHLVIHGNRLNRIGPPIWNWTQQDRSWGTNMTFSYCTNCSFTFSASVSSLGSSGIQWRGAGGILVGNIVRDGGQASLVNPGAATINDGMTILNGEGSLITNNISMNNTDVDLIVSHITNAIVRNNLILHEVSSPIYAFHFSQAGLMLDDFNAPAYNDSSNGVINGNLVICNGTCRIGMELGPYPWYPGTSLAWGQPGPGPTCVTGAQVTANAIIGAPIGINISGAAASVVDNFVWGSEGLINPQPLCSVNNVPLNNDNTNASCQSTLSNNRDGVGQPLPQTNVSMSGCI